MSKGEDKIVDLLNKEKIKYIREKTFSDLKHGLFRYDFYLPDVDGGRVIIEFNGE
jgi:D-alanine-D-alanine ligase-like ATP-grasp enzyme